ncbi:MAG: hypothetical protein IPK77_14925 [Cellvibrio sp.]|jgi:ABC-2 type transport system permease protein|nr:hypothetical protein [Cellvibrio sp.]
MTISVKKLHAQLKREINEYKISIIYTPIVLSIISLAIAIGTFYYFFIAKLGEVSHIKNLYDAVPMAMYANAGLISGVYFWILINYLTSCLYDDRKSKQILFWRSLPVSEGFNVVGKLIMVMVFAPLFIMLINLVMAILFSALALIAANMTGTPMEFPELSANHVLVLPFQIAFDNFFGSLYLMPFIGYFLLVSAGVNRFPFVIALGVPMLLTFMDYLLNQIQISIGVMSAIKQYAQLWVDILPAIGLQAEYHFKSEHLAFLLSSIAVGVIFIIASIWLRNNRYEI